MNDHLTGKDPAFEGMGQIEVDFLGQRIVIGCIEGDEEKTLRLVKRLENDAGECTKAVSNSIEPIQAMLMASVFNYDLLEQAEGQADTNRASS